MINTLTAALKKMKCLKNIGDLKDLFECESDATGYESSRLGSGSGPLENSL